MFSMSFLDVFRCLHQIVSQPVVCVGGLGFHLLICIFLGCNWILYIYIRFISKNMDKHKPVQVIMSYISLGLICNLLGGDNLQADS